MRLLQCDDDGKFTFTKYLAPDVPKYAILSHTWGMDGDEITYKDLVDGVWEGKAGHRKLTLCAKQAKCDGHSFFWIDTCCIDKSSSAELQEAINSMFRWYRDAAVCYVYLSDVQKRGSSSGIKQQISESRWFTRGWTLQELLAPENIIFYSEDWQYLGTKLDLLDTISNAAGIEPRFLKADMEELNSASISKKMSWASYRQTSRTEDEAYCLLGIFGINIPLLYGEGRESFRRLQEEIMKTYPFDHTLFAWGTLVQPENWSRRVPVAVSRTKSSVQLPWDDKKSTELLLGLFAESPRDFQASGDFTPWYNTSRFCGLSCSHNLYPTTVGRAVRLEIPIIEPESDTSIYFWDVPACTQERKTKHILLLCGLESSNSPCVRIPVQSWGELSWGRTRELCFQESDYSKSYLETIIQTINVEPERRVRARNGDVILAQMYAPVGFDAWPNHISIGIHFIENEFVIRQAPAFDITHPLFIIYVAFPPPRTAQGIIIFFNRLAPTESAQHSVGQILASLVPVSFDCSDSDGIFLDNILWFNSKKGDLMKPLTTRMLAIPFDLWSVEHPNLPRIQLSSQRMSIDNDGSSVDVMRFFVLENRNSTLSTASTEESRASLRPGFTRTF